MKVAYFTPLNPKNSGISDYNEELLMYLKKHLAIHLFLDGYSPSNQAIRSNFEFYNGQDFLEQHAENSYQACVYHVGNNHFFHEYLYLHALDYPGIVVMHDYAIHHMIAGMLLERGKTVEYLEEFRYNHGDAALAIASKSVSGETPYIWETSSLIFPMNKRIIDSAKGIIVHSKFTHDLIKKIRPEVPIQIIPHHCADILEDPEEAKATARKKLGIDDNTLMLASFGNIVPAKRVHVILRALQSLSHIVPDFCYYLVGEEVRGYSLRALVKKLGLTRNVIFTGYTDLECFKDYMKAADICLNLRCPIQGETSGSLMRLLGMGKAVLVSDTGPFSEIPSDVVVKINIDQTEENCLVNALTKLMANPDLLADYGAKALAYVRNNCTLEQSALSYSQFISAVVQERGELATSAARRIITEVAEHLAELGVTGEQESFIQEVAVLIDEIGVR